MLSGADRAEEAKVICSFMFSFTASAQGLGKPPDVGLPTEELPALIIKIVNYSLVLVGVLALAMIVYGGFLYITAHGDTQQVEKGKTIIIFAVIGIVIIGLAAALVNFVVQGVIGG